MKENQEQSEGLAGERAQRRSGAAFKAVERQGRRLAGEEQGLMG